MLGPMGDGAQETNGREQVTLVLPATPEYVRLARLASADTGSRAGFDYEEIDDLRIAVSELCYLLIGSGTSGTITMELGHEQSRVVIEGHTATPGTALDTTLSETILKGVVDEHAVSDGADGRRFRLAKTHRD
jgi:serine/threonine-protein kinase RsbW